MGPGDSYLLQYSRNIESFWATPYSLALGTRFRAPADRSFAPAPRQLVTQASLRLPIPHVANLQMSILQRNPHACLMTREGTLPSGTLHSLQDCCCYHLASV